jgi:NAD+ kinase
MSETLQHLILVRHGESEGDVRRAAWKRGELTPAVKLPEEEELTAKGEAQSQRAGVWIAKNIIRTYGLQYFDGCYVSSALRGEQSAAAMDLAGVVWQDNYNLDERNRGHIRGLRAEQHRGLFPDSYAAMKANPLTWVPPDGESIAQVAVRARQFLSDIEGALTVLAVTHRDWMWAAMQPLEGLSDEELLAVNTDEIHNAHITHYTSIDPVSGEQAPALLWKRSIDPVDLDAEAPWQYLAKAAALHSVAG